MITEHILVVDDFKDSRDAYEFFLARQGFRVTLAGDGQEALDKAFELQPDLVVMDLSIPVVSGWEAIRRLKAHETTRHIPVVVLSGHELSDTTSVLGCEAFLVKPCLPDEMIAEIITILDRTTNPSSSRSTRGNAAYPDAGPLS